MRIIVAILSLVGLATWSIVAALAVGLAWKHEPADILMIVPFAYFLFSFLSCFSFINGNALKYGGIISHVLLVGLLVFIFASAGEPAIKLLFGIVAIVFALLWLGMFKTRINNDRTQPGTPGYRR